MRGIEFKTGHMVYTWLILKSLTKRDGMSLRIYDIPKDYKDSVGLRQVFYLSQEIDKVHD